MIASFHTLTHLILLKLYMISEGDPGLPLHTLVQRGMISIIDGNIHRVAGHTHVIS